MKPEFKPGKNIAMKVPSHEFEKTVRFYEHILGLQRIPLEPATGYDSVAFEYGGKNLWIDSIPEMSQAEIWLEIETSDVARARRYLEAEGCVVRHEIETLPESINGFWLSSPSNIIHLVVE